jgi:hypothetical protein
MLTRYRELYNNLTGSKAFAESGAMDNSKINKNTFTPNNLKAIILGADGVVVVYFTSNDTNRKLVSYLPFYKLPKTEEELAQSLKSEKGMVDALCDGLKFSNIEEIFLCTEGFNPVDAEKEYARLLAFANNKLLIQKSFKRLRGIALINKPLTPDSASSLSNEGTLASQFKKADLPVQTILTLEPEKNELGLLKNIELDNGEYKLDAKYNPDADAKERDSQDCRLSKYFYMLEQKARKAKEEATKAQAETNVKKVEEQKKEEVVYDAQVETAVNATINKLEALYSPLWGKQYEAMFCDNGLKYTETNKNFYNRNKSIVDAMYSAWKEVANIHKVVDIESSSFDINADFSPGFHHSVLNSRELWSKGKEGSKPIKAKIKANYLKLYNDFYYSKPEQLDILERRLTNCMIIKKWGKNDVLLRFTGIKSEQKEQFERIFKEKLAATYRGGSLAGKIANCEINAAGIGTLTYIVDWQGFLDEILFAHKLYTESGVKPSLTNAYLGLKMDGTPLTLNLIETNQMLYTILAGSRSGKGTLTMALLACLLGAGGSVAYLDNKPDIGAMLWDLEREYSNQGLKLLSLDIGKEMHEFTGSTPIRSGELNLLPQDMQEATAFRTLRLCKLFQLVTLLGKHSSEFSKKLGISTDNLFFIIDELTSLNTDFTRLELYVKDMSKKYKSIADKQKATDEDKALAKYYETLENMITQMNVDLVQGVTKDWGMSGIRVILIGQELGVNWKVAGKGFNSSFAGKLMNATHKTIAGRLQANDNTYAFNDSQALLADQTGVFNLSKKAPSPINASAKSQLIMDIDRAENFQQFRSYFSLIENDFNYKEFIEEGADQYVTNHPKRFTTQLLDKYLQKGEIAINKVVEELYDIENNRVRDEISFSGLVKVMQRTTGISDETLISNMNKGYQVVDGLFKLLGFTQYQHLEEYLCDCSPDSVFTLVELKGILGLPGGSAPQKKVQRKNDVIDIGIDMDEEINIFNSSDYSSDAKEDNTNYKAQANPLPNPNTTSIPAPIPTQSNKTENTSYVNGNTHVPQYKNAHKGLVDVPFMKNPFNQRHSADGLNTISVLKDMTKFILNDIANLIGNLDRVEFLQITNEGVFIINKRPYQPTFETAFLESLPLMIREKVQEGAILELFYLHEIYKFTNLQKLIVDDKDLASGRLRSELIIPAHQRYSYLFKKLSSLNYIKVGDKVYSLDIPDFDEPALNEIVQELPFRERLKSLGKYLTEPAPQQAPSRMSKFWNSKSVKLLRTAVGYTAGTKLVIASSFIFGPWSLLFGAFFLAAKYEQYKKDNPDYELDNSKKRNANRGKNKGNSKNKQKGKSRSNNNRNNR